MSRETTRRRLLVALGGGSVLGTAGPVAGTPGGRSREYSQPSFDAGRTGFGPGVSGPTDGVTAAWRREFGRSVSRSVAVVDDTVYGVAGRTAFAVDAASGATVWLTRLDRFGSSGGVTVRDGTVFLTVGGAAYALDAGSGAVGWSAPLGARARRSAVVAGDTLYAPVRTGELVAVSTDDGTERWRFDTGNENVGAPAFARGTVFVATGGPHVDGTLHALDGSDGSVRWQFSTDAGGGMGTAVHGGTVFVGFRNDLFALRASDGTKRWVATEGGGSYGGTSPAVAYGSVFGATDGTRVRALDRGTGRLRWDSPIVASGRKDADGAPVVADRTVYVTAHPAFGDQGPDVLAAFDVRTGRRRWRADLDGRVRHTPAVAGGRAFVGTSGGTLYAFEEP